MTDCAWTPPTTNLPCVGCRPRAAAAVSGTSKDVCFVYVTKTAGLIPDLHTLEHTTWRKRVDKTEGSEHVLAEQPNWAACRGRRQSSHKSSVSMQERVCSHGNRSLWPRQDFPCLKRGPTVRVRVASCCSPVRAPQSRTGFRKAALVLVLTDASPLVQNEVFWEMKFLFG